MLIKHEGAETPGQLGLTMLGPNRTLGLAIPKPKSKILKLQIFYSLKWSNT